MAPFYSLLENTSKRFTKLHGFLNVHPRKKIPPFPTSVYWSFGGSLRLIGGDHENVDEFCRYQRSAACPASHSSHCGAALAAAAAAKAFISLFLAVFVTHL